MHEITFRDSGKEYTATLTTQKIGEITWYSVLFTQEDIISKLGHELRFVKRGDYLSCVNEPTRHNAFIINHLHDQILLHILQPKNGGQEEDRTEDSSGLNEDPDSLDLVK